jgi:hypothetical protein
LLYQLDFQRQVREVSEACVACKACESGPHAAMSWAFSCTAENTPNIILFLAALLGLLK